MYSATYDGVNFASETDRNGTSSYVYNYLNQQIQSTDTDGVVSEMAYNDNNQLIRLTTAGKVMEFSFDTAGRETHSDFGDGVSSDLGYTIGAPDWTSFSTGTGGRVGRVRSFTYGPQSDLDSATDVGGNVWTYAEPSDNTFSVTSPGGEVLTVENDDSLNPARIVYPDGGIATMVYEEYIRLSQLTLPSGTVVDYVYDALDRLVGRTSSLGESEITSYNSEGRVATVSDSTGMSTMSYDSASRFAGFENGAGASIEYVRDTIGQVTQVRTKSAPGATTDDTSYTYNAVGNITSITDPLGGITSFTYDAVHRKTSRSLPNGIVTSYGYDLRDRIVHRDASSAILASFAYERTATGEPTRITREDGSFAEFEYSLANAVTSERRFDAGGALQSETLYTYDIDGNRTSKTTAAGTDIYAMSAGFRLDSVAGPNAVDYSFDANGRVTTIVRDGSTTDLTYSSTDRLISSTTDSAVTGYGIDAAGRRVSIADAAGTKDLLNAPSLGGGLDSPHLVVDRSSGTTVARYVYQGEHPLMRIDATGQPEYYLEDAMNSVIATASSIGTLSASFEYDSFGLELSASSALPSDTSGDFRFHGMWQDPSGLYHVRARQYDAKTGRFLSRDAAEGNDLAPETWHPYQFAFSNPHLYRDPSGLVNMASLQSSFSIQNILRSLPRVAINEAKDNIVGKILSFVVESAIKSVAPGISLPGPAISGFSKGDLFEDAVEGVACATLGAVNAEHYIHREVPVAIDGKPLDDGFPCGADQEFRDINVGVFGDDTRPDFLISPRPPSEVTTRKKSYLVADAKLKIELKSKKPSKRASFYRQLNKMGAHASGYSWSHTVAYITFYRVRKFSLLKMRKALAKKEALLLVVGPTGIQK